MSRQLDALRPSEPIIRSIDLGHRRTLSLYQLLSRPIGTPGCAPWAVLLFPTLLGTDLEVPASTRELYRRLQWDGPMTAGSLEVRVEIEFVVDRGETYDVGVHTVARTLDGATGRAFSVLRCSADVGQKKSFGTPTLPPPPRVGETSSGHRFVIDTHSLDQFLDVMHVDSAVVASASAAHQQGLPNRLVPSGVLLVAATRGRDIDAGEVEMWFTGPSPAGAVLNVGVRKARDSVVGEVLLPSGREVASFVIRDRPQVAAPSASDKAK